MIQPTVQRSTAGHTSAQRSRTGGSSLNSAANVSATSVNDVSTGSIHSAVGPSTGRLPNVRLTHCDTAISTSAASSSAPPPSTIRNEITRSRSVAKTTLRTRGAISGGSIFQIARKLMRRCRNSTEAVSRRPIRLTTVAPIDSSCKVSMKRSIVSLRSVPKRASMPASTWRSVSAICSEKRSRRPSAASNSSSSGTSEISA